MKLKKRLKQLERDHRSLSAVVSALVDKAVNHSGRLGVLEYEEERRQEAVDQEATQDPEVEFEDQQAPDTTEVPLADK